MPKIFTVKKLMILLGVLVVILLGAVISIYPDWLWFMNLNFAPVFWTMLLGKLGLAAVIWLLIIIILSINLYAAQRFHPVSAQRTSSTGELPIFGKNANALILVGILIVSFVIASRGSALWDMVLRYLYQQPFGSNDPVFNKDIGFYVFSLPFYMFVWEQLLVVFLFAGLATIIWYIKDGGLEIIGELAQDQPPVSLPKITITEPIRKHLLILGSIIVLLIGWGFHLKVYGILYSTQGPAFGASYTDVHVRIPIFRILMVISFIWGLFLIYTAFNFKIKHFLLSGAVWIGAILVLAYGLPIAVQKVVVKPNELAKESPFIAYNIDHTRKAYNLNNIQEVDFEVSDSLTSEKLKDHDVTIQNIRIWDERPLLQTYRQIQSIRLYYDFNDMDVDRYLINNRYRQVMLSARELVVNQLPRQAQTWVNRHLIYTHGYGLAMSPVNEVTSEGLPRLMIKDLPPYVDIDLKVDRPEIYYGEKTNEYVLIRTSAKEFDFPKGDKNVYTSYQGKGGVPIKSLIRRLVFAIEFLDTQILFTTYLGPESKIMYNRRIDWRVNTIAPFLAYDTDPYLVISGGRLFWIQDAYTTSNMYPYSRRSKSHFRNRWLNYIRNSVKVVIDAYNGSMDFYIIDQKDPVAEVYKNIFPQLFKNFDQMPEDLRGHIRYPKDLFQVQAELYSTYHMMDPDVFYNKEDYWNVPNEIYAENEIKMEPYYIVTKLPGHEREEFILMTPFTPSTKNNMIAWLAAKNDQPDYGNLIVYKFPKEKLIFGPMQIEARIDQDSEISQQLTLWGQKGSTVIRGNLLVIPIEKSIIYVEPLYLRAEMGEIPELKRVIVSNGSDVAIGNKLEDALEKLFTRSFSEREIIVTGEEKTLKDLIKEAAGYYESAQEFAREGNWSKYGEELQKLEQALKLLEEASERE